MPQKKFPSYTNPKIELRPYPQKGGFGLFARELIYTGELLSGWSGEMFTGEQLVNETIERQTHGIQVGENLYLLPIGEGEQDPADFYNHSCNPNAGLDGQICIVAMRDIRPDEEICFDYAMSDSSDYDEFECHCGAPNCRGKVTGNDWKIPELQERYKGYFMPYLQHRIDSLKSAKKSG
jgi:uncharacterized protein